ncbi:MAG TPA: tannase/feruloyl esterase family alpha/beta hydrolase [Burkholderiaceae bacterium]|nr:tannase/feruloyl esterase family alpha/beta hydrolase [Burkholderiaceae bacterium]
MNRISTWVCTRNVLLSAGAIAALAACGGGESGLTMVPSLASENLSINPTVACTMQGVGAAKLSADAPVSILEVSTGTTGTGPADKPYCLVKVKVDPQVNIWVSLPTTAWNGRFRAEGNGVYAGDTQLGAAVDSVRQGFVGTKTDTGHTGFFLSGAFGMESPGKANTQLQIDFAYRSEHLMAVVGKQLTKAFYGQDPVRSYWYGCSTGGRQGLMMAQRYPNDYDAILAGAPAIHWDRFQAYQIWPQVAMRFDAGGPLSAAKRQLASSRAVAACDAADGVADGVLADPRTCTYDPTKDASVTRANCTSADDTCLTPGEASAVQKIWGGARSASGQLLWPGVERGADLAALAGASPFPIPIEQARYWVYFDPAWDWKTLTFDNYEAFFNKSAQMVGPVMATDNPDLTAFKARGGKLIMYHGWSDNLIMPQGTVRYYDRMRQTVPEAENFSRLYMVPGMGHCGGGAGVNEFGQGASGSVPMEAKTDIFRALMAWSEKGVAPSDFTASRIESGAVSRTQPLCPYPLLAKYKGSGSTTDASNYNCAAP